MTCHRCGGLMLAEQYDDLYNNYAEQAGFAGWRCVNCGAVLDQVIAGNHRHTACAVPQNIPGN